METQVISLLFNVMTSLESCRKSQVQLGHSGYLDLLLHSFKIVYIIEDFFFFKAMKLFEGFIQTGVV